MSSMHANKKMNISIKYDGNIINDVLCKICLPERMTDKLELILYPTREQSRQLMHTLVFSMYGESKDFTNEINYIIKSDKVYCINGSTKNDGNYEETVLICEPDELTIIDQFNKNADITEEEMKLTGEYWITTQWMTSRDGVVLIALIIASFYIFSRYAKETSHSRTW